MRTCIRKNNSRIKILLITGVIFFILFTGTTNAHAQLNSETGPFIEYNSLVGAGIDYLVPTRYSNPINTVSLHAFFWKRQLKNISILLHTGITTSYAWGYSRQLYRISPDTLLAIDHKTSAFGAGPLIQIENVIIKARHFSVLLEASGAFLLYNKVFPYGGDIYNFMTRTGPSFAYKINSRCFLKIGYRWMHVSNGKGHGNQNPFYEAQGVNVGILLIR